MKEATGELSTTVIAVIAISAIAALFIAFLYPQLKASITLNKACLNGSEYKFEGTGYTVFCTDKEKRTGTRCRGGKHL